MGETATISRWLKQRRQELDVAQEELAPRIGCSYIAIRKMEAGVRRPSKQMVELLADRYKVPAEERKAFIGFDRGVDTGKDEPQQALDAAASGPPTNLPSSGNLPAQLTV